MTYFRPQIGATVTQTSIFKLDQNQTSLNKTQNTPATTTFYLSEHTNSLFISKLRGPRANLSSAEPGGSFAAVQPQQPLHKSGSFYALPFKGESRKQLPRGRRASAAPPPTQGPAGAADLGRLQIGQWTAGGGPGREPRGTKVAGQALSRGCWQKCQGPGGRTRARLTGPPLAHAARGPACAACVLSKRTTVGLLDCLGVRFVYC